MKLRTIANNCKDVLATLMHLKIIIWSPDHAAKFFWATLLTLFMIGCNAGVLLLFKHVIALLGLQNASSFALFVLIAYGIVWTLNQAITQIRPLLVQLILEESSNRFSHALFNHLHTLSLRFHLERHTGALASAMDRAQHGIEALFWGIFLFLIPTLLEIVAAIGVISYLYGVSYGMAILSILALYCAGNIISMGWSKKAHELYNNKRSSTNALMIDSLINFETVKYFTNQVFEDRLCKKALDEQKQASYNLTLLSALLHLVQVLIIGAGLTLLTWFSGQAVLRKSLEISDFVLINGYILQFILPLSYFGYLVQQIRKGFIDVSDAITLLKKT